MIGRGYAKKTKVGTMVRMSLVSSLTPSACMVEQVFGRHRRQALLSCVQFQPCKDPEDCHMGRHNGRPMATGHT